MTSIPEGTVRVAREGARGHHLIDRAKYDADPKAFSLVDDDGKPLKTFKADPLDHDADGKKGGTVVPPSDPVLGDLRKQYRTKFGKGAGPKWTAAQISEKLAAE